MECSPRKDITAAIVNYGNEKDTADLVRLLDGQVSNIIIVDNSNNIDANNDDFKHTCVITPEKNIGFGAAINLAAKQLETRWLLILNPDVRLQKDCLAQLLAASNSLNAPLCGPRFFWDDECTLQLPPALGHPLWLLSDRHIPNNNLADSPDLSTLAIARHVRFWKESAAFSEPVLSGACMLIDNVWFVQHKMPIFDEDFFLYYEDTDLCGRLMRKGVMPICVPDAHAVHYWNQSAEPPEGKATLMQDSEKIFLKKYYPNGAPPLPRSTPNPDYTDLGIVTLPLQLTSSDEACHLDIGVQDDFIVFVRAELQQSSFRFTEPMWQRLKDGRYFLRTVDKSGQSCQQWQFEKIT